MSITEKQHICLEANKNLIQKKLVFDTFGNASSLVQKSLLIKPSGVDLNAITEEDISVVDLTSGTHLSGKKPSSDTPTHLEIYRVFPNLGGIVHTHSLYATAWAQAGKPIPCLGTTHADYWKGVIPVTRPLTEEEITRDYEAVTGKVIVETINQLGVEVLHCPGILVPHHGPFTWGATIDEAVRNAQILEYVAQMAWITLQISPTIKQIPSTLHQKHFLRKHGKNAYYGHDTK